MSRQVAAAELGVDVETVDRMCAEGLLDRHVLRGRYVRVPASQVAELVGLPPEWLRRC
ncbi:helix-turn-helix DNA-binding protein [Streptomyces phage Mischief19]|nr:helix-turn-helix DNA-binding protein [Streptomyces phage Mischief19]